MQMCAVMHLNLRCAGCAADSFSCRFPAVVGIMMQDASGGLHQHIEAKVVVV